MAKTARVSVKVPHAAAGIVFTMYRGKPHVLVAERSNELKERWHGLLQFGPAGRVDEPMNVALSRSARANVMMRRFVDAIDPISLRVQDWREVLIHQRDNLAKSTIGLLRRHPSFGRDGAERFAKAAIALSRRIAFLPERTLTAVRRETKEELGFDIGVGANEVVSVVPLAEVPPLSDNPNENEHLHASFFLIRVTPEGIRQIIENQGSKELVAPRTVSLDEAEKLASSPELVQPHFYEIIKQEGLLRNAISKMTEWNKHRRLTRIFDL